MEVIWNVTPCSLVDIDYVLEELTDILPFGCKQMIFFKLKPG